jgi:hypothetical protein
VRTGSFFPDAPTPAPRRLRGRASLTAEQFPDANGYCYTVVCFIGVSPECKSSKIVWMMDRKSEMASKWHFFIRYFPFLRLCRGMGRMKQETFRVTHRGALLFQQYCGMLR